MTYDDGVPPGDAAHVRSTVEPDTVATRLFGAAGGAIVSAACSRPGNDCHVLTARQAGFADSDVKTPCAAELVRQLQDRAGVSFDCARNVTAFVTKSTPAQKRPTTTRLAMVDTLQFFSTKEISKI